MLLQLRLCRRDAPPLIRESVEPTKNDAVPKRHVARDCEFAVDRVSSIRRRENAAFTTARAGFLQF